MPDGRRGITSDVERVLARRSPMPGETQRSWRLGLGVRAKSIAANISGAIKIHQGRKLCITNSLNGAAKLSFSRAAGLDQGFAPHRCNSRCGLMWYQPAGGSSEPITDTQATPPCLIL